MSEPNARERSPDRLALGGYVLDLAAGELLTPERQLAGLRKQALEVLLALGRRAGQVVGKDELMDLVWPRVVVGEGSLTQAIAEIRRALGDAEHRLVRNVARRGYMLVADAPGDAPELSIAVMPFTIEGVAGEGDWFADALHGDLVGELTRMHGTLVIGRGTMATYKDRAVDPRQVARELRVRHVVLASLRHEDAIVRLSIALVDGASGVQRWTETFVAERARLPQMIAELAMRIGRALLPQLYRSAVERRAALSALEVSADDLAMRAAVLWYRGLRADNLAEALQLAERAVALDPDSARGWFCITFIGVHALLNGWVTDRAAMVCRIDEATAQLERLDGDAFSTHQAKVIQSFVKQDWMAMLRLAETWAERSQHPNAFGARGYALLLHGRADEAVAALERALRLAPREPVCAEWQYRLAMAHFVAERYELACDWAQTAALTNPNLPWPPVHAAAMHRLGHAEEAGRVFSDFLARHPAFTSMHVAERLPGDEPRLAEARERLLGSLKALGLR
ncbi:MAG: winged helix-turn-helix domain-containing protein [Burkholderiaceae bacterium]|nr:winged helix-turn-helix domain-containing protein [Burkholderiaceae bacterium]